MSTAEVTPIHPTVAVQEAFDRLKAAWRASGAPSYDERVAQLRKLHAAIKRNKDALVEAIDADFSHRSKHETLAAEVFPTLASIEHTLRHLRGWMRPKRAPMTWILLPASARIDYQPKGVIGVIAPWNYPAQLALLPVAAAIAAGNRVLLKPSELTPRTSDLVAKICAEAFEPDRVAVVTGGPDVGEAVTRLPFNHLLFTGSTFVGRKVALAAAENLVPTTLELGGKSPAIVHPDYPLDKAADRITYGKLLNAGQTCIAPDYAMVPSAKREAFVEAMKAAVARQYPNITANTDYTAIITDKHRARLEYLVADARTRGATIVELAPVGAAFEGGRKYAPTLILDCPDDAEVMQNEIFGPLLPVKPYGTLEEAIAWVNDHPRPLALYYFDHDAARVEKVLRDTTAGGVTVNDTMLHFAAEDLPFGGVGPSGMGAYHGFHGFRTFSHEKGVFWQSRLNGTSLITPPYGTTIERLLAFLIGR